MRLPDRPPNRMKLLTAHADRLAEIWNTVTAPTVSGRYLHWHELQYRPSPPGLTRDEWWLGLRLRRDALTHQLPLTDTAGSPFGVASTEAVQRSLHELGALASGHTPLARGLESVETRKRHLRQNLMEEGIHSSLLEGASTTREQAIQMLRTHTPPNNRGEQMVFNNFATMQFIVGLGDTELTPEVVFQIHEIVTHKTLDTAGAEGRFRLPHERVLVVDARDNEVLYEPPPAKQLPARLDAMCAFANGGPSDVFVHPILRSILLHFWLAYDHPFVDGNGRCARALFYWSMLRHKYWLSEMISISAIIAAAPTQYARAYLHGETDGNDATYFVLHQLDILERAFQKLQQHVAGRAVMKRNVERVARRHATLNDRQSELISHFMDYPDEEIEIKNYQRQHGVVYQTARSDLLQLVKAGLLTMRKRGKTFVFRPSTRVAEIPRDSAT